MKTKRKASVKLTWEEIDVLIEKADKLDEPKRTLKIKGLIKQRHMLDKRSDALERTLDAVRKYICKDEPDDVVSQTLTDIVCKGAERGE